MLRSLITISIIICSISVSAQRQNGFKQKIEQLSKNRRSVSLQKRKTEKHSKLVAVGLNISLGLFGVHRLYLGTSPVIPVIYTFTLGGGGVLMITDLGAIIFAKDLEQYANNPHVIMWTENKEVKLE